MIRRRVDWYAIALGIVLVVGSVRIIATYGIFSETIDEPAHVGAGIEWLDHGTYLIDQSHPPLSRIAAAMWPYLSGIGYVKTGHFVSDGNAVLYARGQYRENLFRARIGILPFFLLATLIVAGWARSVAGDIGGVAAAALFSNEPTVLAHAGLTTTDMAAAALIVAAAYVFRQWLALTSFRVSLLLGVAVGGALLAKFSSLLFLPLALISVLICHFSPIRRGQTRGIATSLLVVVLTAGLTTWAGYRFSVGSLRSVDGAEALLRSVPEWLRDRPIIPEVSDLSIPAPEFVHGVLLIRAHAERGHTSYVFGRFRPQGTWYYFPLAIAVKTTLGFLGLIAIGSWIIVSRSSPPLLAPLLAALLILVASIPASINIGIRHVLPLYPYLAVVGGIAVSSMWRSIRGRWIAGGLCAAALASSVLSHPDYLPYFNALAGPRPEEVLLDSNFDWGQDFLRLETELRRRRIDSVALAYAGNAEPDRHDLPPFTRLEPYEYTPGWIAISETSLRTPEAGFQWLELFRPVGRAGKTIRLYYVPDPDELRDAAIATPPRRDLAQRTRLLLPIWFEGYPRGQEGWTCELTVRNDNSRPVSLREGPHRSSRVLVQMPPRTTVVNPSLGVEGTTKGVIVHLDRAFADRLHVALRVRSAKTTVHLPVVRERDLRSRPVQFLDVPLGTGTRVTLRIYDLTGQAGSATVRLFEGSTASGERSVPLTRPAQRDLFPPAVEAPLDVLFPDVRSGNARIVVDAPSSQYWGFLSVTDRATNHTYVLLPD